jgi:hypothetical protein
MSLATAPATSPLTPHAFSQCLLEAATLDARRDAQERTRLASLIGPFTRTEVDGPTFEQTLQDHQRQDAALGPAAREVLALWHLCTRTGH